MYEAPSIITVGGLSEITEAKFNKVGTSSDVISVAEEILSITPVISGKITQVS